jgi:hypothetical protein
MGLACNDIPVREIPQHRLAPLEKDARRTPFAGYGGFTDMECLLSIEQTREAEGMAVIHEMRVYEAMPGRLGDLNKRFREITLPIWTRLGIRPVAFWTTLVGPSNNTLFYILSWDSMAERERIWTSFMTDEEWLRRKGEMDQGGVLVARAENQLLQLTDYSPRVG